MSAFVCWLIISTPSKAKANEKQAQEKEQSGASRGILMNPLSAHWTVNSFKILHALWDWRLVLRWRTNISMLTLTRMHEEQHISHRYIDPFPQLRVALHWVLQAHQAALQLCRSPWPLLLCCYASSHESPPKALSIDLDVNTQYPSYSNSQGSHCACRARFRVQYCGALWVDHQSFS